MILAKKRKKSLASIICILALLFVSEDVFLFGTYENTFFVSIKTVVQITLFLVLFAFFFFSRKKNTIGIYFFAILVLIVISMLINTDIRAGYVFMIMVLVSCKLSIILFGIDFIFDVLFASMTFLCTYSVLLFIVSLLFPSLISLLPIIKNINGIEYYFGLFSNILVHHGGMARNYGPFREPGVFQMFIVVSLIYGLFRKEEKNYFALIIHVIAIITTFSTTGYISLFFIIIALILDNTSTNKKTNRLILVLTVSGLLFLTFRTDLIYKVGYGSVFGKLFGTYNSISMTARKASVFANLKMAIRNPIIGNGITYVENNFPVLAESMYGFFTRDNTNTLLIQLARFGVVFFGLSLYGYYRFSLYFIYAKRITKWFVLLAFICLLFGENLSYSYLFSLVLVSGLEKDDI